MSRTGDKQVKLLGGAVLLVMMAASAVFWFSWKYWGGFQTVMGDEFVRRAGAIGV
jgi:hypothetical protein